MSGFDPVAYINEPRWQESRMGLERIRELLGRMGRPQDRLRFVHVAGTNGKGSVCAYLASALQAAGYRTGLFTSPYLIEFEERIRVNGENIPPGDLRAVTLLVREHAEDMAAETGEHPTEFELMTAVAFEHFARRACDIVVCEVGLGGRLDSTNVIGAPEACVIARIGLDHTDLLGDTVEAVAREKAGIVKPGAPVVSWPQEDAAMRVVEEAALACGSPLSVADVAQLDGTAGAIVWPGRGPAGAPGLPAGPGAGAEGASEPGGAEGAVPFRPFRYRGQDFTTRLLGSYQPANAALAIEALHVLRGRGWNVPDEAIRRGIADARWPGRFEVASAGPPPVVVDGGHNPQGAAVLADSLRDVFPGKRVAFVMGVLADKDYRAMIRAVAPLAAAFVCATPPSPRALPAGELAEAVLDEAGAGVPVAPADGFPRALERARRLAGPDGVVCAFGSLYSVAEIKGAL